MLSLRRFASTQLWKQVVVRHAGSMAPKKLSFPKQAPRKVIKQNHTDVYNLYVTRTYEGTTDGDVCHGQGKVTYENGKTLEGEFRMGKLYTGHGTIILPNTGTTYEGQFLEGKAHGQGRETYADGRYLEGEWEEGVLMNGKGIMSRRDYLYDGEFKGGKRHGHGKWTSLVGNSYHGQWVAGKQHGQGTFTYADGSVLQGEFKHGNIYNGQGVLQLSGVRYEGKFVEGAVQGTGKITYPDGSIYVGESVNKKKHGQGTLTYKTGQSITGQWKRGNVRNAQGTYILSDGTVLVGTWINGVNADVPNPPPTVPTDGSHYEGPMVNYRYHGTGKLTNPDGSTLVGEFRNGLIYTGKGVQIDSSGEKVASEWKDGVCVGLVKRHSPDGAVLLHTITEGATHESGKLTYPDGAVYIGQWLGGKQHGNGRLTTRTGDVYDGAFVAGRKEGHGKLVQKLAVYEGQWVNNLYHGTGELKYKNGLLLQGEFRQGRIYTGSGTIQIDGNHTFSGAWVEGHRHGHGKVSLTDGTVVLEGEWVHGVVSNGTSSISNSNTVDTSGVLEVDYSKLLHITLEGVFAGGELVHGTLLLRDGTVYNGDIKQGKYHGTGTCTDHNGDVYECTWVAGVREGPGKVTYKDGTEWVGEFKNGTTYTGSGVYRSKAGVRRGTWERGVFTAATSL